MKQSIEGLVGIGVCLILIAHFFYTGFVCKIICLFPNCCWFFCAQLIVEK